MILCKGQTGSKYRPTGPFKKCKVRIWHFSLKRPLLYFFPQSAFGKTIFPNRCNHLTDFKSLILRREQSVPFGNQD